MGKRGELKGPRSVGARLLRAYIDGGNGAPKRSTVPAFCDEHGLNRITVQRYLNGERTRVTVNFAAAIETATNGAVPIKAWLSPAAAQSVEVAA